MRHFTPDEANELLPTVRDLTEQLVAHRRAFVVAEHARVELAGQVAGNGHGVNPRELADLDEALERELGGIARAVTALQELGVQVKDLDSGLVDFPARRGTEEILLCWRLGEDAVEFWHGADEGFAGRKPLRSDGTTVE